MLRIGRLVQRIVDVHLTRLDPQVLTQQRNEAASDGDSICECDLNKHGNHYGNRIR